MANETNTTQTELQYNLDPQEVQDNDAADIVEDTPSEQPREARQRDNDDEADKDERQHARAPDDKRKDIFKSFSRKNSKPFGDPNDQDVTYGTQSSPSEADADEGVALEGAPNPETPQQPAPTEGKERIVINGQERFVTKDELIAMAQKAGNADRVTEEATTKARELDDGLRRLKELEARANQPASDTRTGTEQPQSPTSPEQDADPDAGLAEIAEQIQLGDTQEAVQALKRLGERLQPGQSLSEADIINAVRKDQDQAADRQARQEFATANPDFKPDDPVQNRLFNAALRVERESDILAAAEILGRSRAEVQQKLAEADDRYVDDLHRQMRVAGYAPRAHKDVYGAAYRHLSPSSQGANPASGVNISPERQKRAANAQPQPAPRGPAAVPQTRENTRSDVVTQMRKARGQPVATN